MSLFITSLNSGSNGNCYYVANHNEAILVDAGISCREIDKRMKRLGLDMQKVKALFVSHEHSDHIRGIAGLVKKYRVPVYITPSTLVNARLFLDKQLIFTFQPNVPVAIGELMVTAFSKLHDACDPCSFVVEYNDTRVGVFTDLGAPCKNLVHHFKQCNAAFLESNYDEKMLDEGSYPYYLKARIRGGQGHLSNRQALELFLLHRPSFMSHLVLSHLSKNNNCPDIVRELFTRHSGKVKIIVASRYGETEVCQIGESISSPSPVKKVRTTIAPQLAFAFG